MEPDPNITWNLLLQEMCGPEGFVIWSPRYQDVGLCFQALCLKIPVLVLLAGISAFYCGRQQFWVQREKSALRWLLLRAACAMLLATEVIFRVSFSIENSVNSFYPVSYLLYGVECLTWLVHFCYILALRNSLDLSPRGPITICVLWTIIFALQIVSLRSYKIIWSQNVGIINYYFELIAFVTQTVYLLTCLYGKQGLRIARPVFNPYHSFGPSPTAQNEERQGLLSAAYNGFREERDPSYLGVALDGTNVFSRMLFYWVHPLMNKGLEAQLNHTDDLFDLPDDLSPALVNDKLDTALGQSQRTGQSNSNFARGYGSVENSDSSLSSAAPSVTVVTPPVSLVRALHKCFAWEFYSIGLLKFISDCAGFVSPLLLSKLVTFIEEKSEAIEQGYICAGGLCAAALISALCNTHFNFFMAKVGMKIRAAIMTTVYRKTLTLSTKSLSDFSTGEIVNFMSTDTDRIVNSCPSFHAFWSIPFQIAVTLYLLYTQVGLAFLAGLCFAIILIPINKFITTKIGSLSTKMMEYKDERVNITTDTLRGIRSIKMHVWEENFLHRIFHYRNKELRYLKGRKYLDALCVYFWATTPVIISVLTFVVYSLLGGDLTAAKVFTTIALLNMLIAPLNAFPWVLNGLIEAWVSISRLQKLLLLPDFDLQAFYFPFPAGPENVSVLIHEGYFRWTDHETVENPFRLGYINLNIQKGQLVGVIGEVGSGKSSLLAAILAEMEKVKGIVAVARPEEGIAFVPQKPWLQRGTIRENILFGKSFDQTRYKKVLDACCLQEDLQCFPNGDRHGVAEGASNLSGGQQARIALARAVYQDMSVYILDDVLSAVDPPVAHHIFHNCILKLLAGKTRILTTSILKYLQFTDLVVKMDKGKIVDSGPWTTLIPSSDLEEILLSDSGDFAVEGISHNDETMFNEDTQNEVTLTEEFQETGSLSIGVYGSYFRAMTPILTFLILMSMSLMQFSRNMTDWWMSYWISQNTPPNNVNTILNSMRSVNGVEPILQSEVPETASFYLKVYAVIAVLNTVFTLLRAFLFAYAGICAGTNIHERLLTTIIKARVTFFDVSPLGRILNRLSSDTYTIDDSLPFILNILLAQFFSLLGALFITTYELPWLCLVLIPLVPIYYWLQEHYRKTSRELKRLSSTSLSPIYSHFNESLQGKVSIRAFRATNRFRRDNRHLLESHLKAILSSQAAAQWLGLRVQLIGVAIITGVGVIAVVQHQFDFIDPGVVGLATAYALSLTGTLSGVLNAFTETEREMIAVERAQQYLTGVECEPEVDDGRYPPTCWPTQGVIGFRNVSLRYREHLAPALRHVSFETRPFEKIGVVGRTGAGKSSLFSALFRLIELSKGSITIDTVNIANLRLEALRSEIAVIPQDPFIFSGSIRQNIDPLHKYDDNEIYDALQRCHLRDTVRLLGGIRAPVLSGERSFSAGQKQLLCLTRAILHNAKILCIDEATSNIDEKTDRLIQNTIRIAFRQSTVITIAHRIRTVMDSDRVLVLGGGEVLEFDRPDVLLEDKNSHFYQLSQQLAPQPPRTVT